MSEAHCNVGPANPNVVDVQGPAGDKGQLGATGPSGGTVGVPYSHTRMSTGKTKGIAL